MNMPGWRETFVRLITVVSFVPPVAISPAPPHSPRPASPRLAPCPRQAPAAEVRVLAARQPALLVVAPITIKAALASLTQRMGGSPRDCLDLFVRDPGA